VRDRRTRSQISECLGQRSRFEVNRSQAPSEILRGPDAPLDERDQPGRLLRGLGRRFALDLFGEERDAGQELPESVVKVTADAPLERIALLEQLVFFETDAGHVAHGERVVALPVDRRPREHDLRWELCAVLATADEVWAG